MKGSKLNLMRYNDLCLAVIEMLDTNLPESLTYHNKYHTLDVMNAAELLGAAEGIDGDEMIMLKTAALLHDIGFIRGAKDHEEYSCELAGRFLPEYGYSLEAIAIICQTIIATKIPQTPTNLLGRILCDADLFYFGTDDFEEKAARLYKELKDAGVVDSELEWNIRQLDFLSSHNYFTEAAVTLLQEKKLAHIAALRHLVESGVPTHKKNRVLELGGDFLLMLFGACIAAVALKCFMVPNHFFDGGVTGLALLVHEIYHINLAVVIVLINMPLILAGIFIAGKKFAFKTFISVALLGICLWIVPEFSLTHDKLLIAIFGGVMLGIGIGLTMRTGAALDGIEVLALYTLKRTSFTITEIILGLNILIFAAAAFFFGIESALYSVLTYFAVTRSIDYIVDGLQAYTGVTIISGNSEQIKYKLVNKLGRGITVYKGERGFLPGKFTISTDCDIIFTVITRLELRKLRNLVYETDPKAFIFANTIKEASGGVIKRKLEH